MKDNTDKKVSKREAEIEMCEQQHHHDKLQTSPEGPNLDDICRQADQLFFQKLFHNQLGDDGQPCARKISIKPKNAN